MLAAGMFDATPPTAPVSPRRIQPSLRSSLGGYRQRTSGRVLSEAGLACLVQRDELDVAVSLLPASPPVAPPHRQPYWQPRLPDGRTALHLPGMVRIICPLGDSRISRWHGTFPTAL